MNKNVSVVRTDSTVPVERTEQELQYVQPSTDVFETADAYVVRIDMPGAGKESLSVTVDADMLTVKGALSDAGVQERAVLLTELIRKGYYRSFHLGHGIDRTNIDARYENGVLSLKLSKKEEAKPREISIH